jgi:glutathione S-transferase
VPAAVRNEFTGPRPRPRRRNERAIGGRDVQRELRRLAWITRFDEHAVMSITLWGEIYYFSPYVFSAFVGLKEKGVPFEMRLIDVYSDEQSRPEYQRQTITGRVPALEHDGFWVAESSAIVEYVDEVFEGPPLLPRDAKERARARQLMAWIRSDLLALRDERPTFNMFYERATAPLSAAANASARKLLDVADRVIAPGAKHLFESWSVADADLAFVLHRLILNGHEVPPKIRDYAEQQWTRPAIRAFLDHPRPKEGAKPK